MASNLQFITKVSNDTSGSTFDVPNVFTDKYDEYKIFIRDILTDGATQTNIGIRYIDSSDTVVTSNYEQVYARLNGGAAFSLSATSSIGYVFLGVTDQNFESLNGVITIYNPLQTTYTFTMSEVSTHWDGGHNGYKNSSVQKSSTSMTGFQVMEPSARPFTDCQVSVYGVLK